MYPILCALLAMIGYGSAVTQCQTPPAGTTAVTFQSPVYSDFRQLLTRQPASGTVDVQAYLGFPAEQKDRYPAVVVVHTISGYRDANEGYAASELRAAGYATLTYDSFAARKTTGQAMSGSPTYLPAGVADAYAALRLLASDPRIDPDRIAILGFSYGGEMAHLTAFERLRAASIDTPLRFAAHVAFYPAGNYGVVAGDGGYTGSPVLLLLGGKDDNLPLAKIENYLGYLYAAGDLAPVETATYPDAYHAWTVPSLTTLRFYPEYVSTKKCPMILLGPKQPLFLVGEDTRPFDPAIFGACMAEAPGYSMAYNRSVRAQSISDAVQFLQRKLRR